MALQASSYEQELDTIRLLIACGADVDVITDKYGTALQAAALKEPDLKAVRLLLDNGAHVNARGKYGIALQRAARHGNIQDVTLTPQNKLIDPAEPDF